MLFIRRCLFKISFSISSCLFLFLSSISSFSSSVLLSFSLNDPVVSLCFIHLSSNEADRSYSLKISHFLLPFWYSCTTWLLNSSVNALRSFLGIDSVILVTSIIFFVIPSSIPLFFCPIKCSLFNMLFNIYCDETCHLEKDNINVMVIGLFGVHQEKLIEINQRIKQIKERNDIYTTTELKWIK